jgi:dTMP kinase
MKTHNRFIAIDGPNGVGKSTIIDSLKFKMDKRGLDFILTKEPTNSKLGQFIRDNQNVYSSKTLAALVAADRYDHIKKIIEPTLNDGKLIISDRYVASSLVYQVMDGLDYEFIVHLNNEIILPSLYFILTASPDTLTSRLNERVQLTRFELNTKLEEGKLFEEAGNFLKQKGVTVYFMNNEFRSSEETAAEIMAKITNHLSN